MPVNVRELFVENSSTQSENNAILKPGQTHHKYSKNNN